MKGEFSGGTVASLMNVVKEATSDKALRKELANPFSLCPKEFKSSRRQHNVKSAEYDKDFSAWTAPFVMSAINTRVVHRSNALQSTAYGQDFAYDEAVMTGKGMKGRLAATSMAAGMGGFMLASAIKPTRWALERFVMPKPGEGPSEQAQETGFYDLRFVGITADGQTIRTKVTGDRDPGYGSTSKMLGEAALCLAFDLEQDQEETGEQGESSKKRQATKLGGGFWTPASLLGNKLLDRLKVRAGLRFELLENR
jgi:short subunit dehydrogenase-like uncharacterized protein